MKDRRHYLVELNRLHADINRIADEANLLSIKSKQINMLGVSEVFDAIKNNLEFACYSIEMDCRDDFYDYDIWQPRRGC